MGNVEGVTEGLNMRAKDEVIRSEQGLNPVAHLITYLANIQNLVQFLNIFLFTLFVVLNESSLGTY